MRRIFNYDWQYHNDLWLAAGSRLYAVGQPQLTVENSTAPVGAAFLPLSFNRAGNIGGYALVDLEYASLLARYGPWFLSDQYATNPPKKIVTGHGWRYVVPLSRLVYVLLITTPSDHERLLSDLPKLVDVLDSLPRIRQLGTTKLDCRSSKLDASIGTRAVQRREQRAMPVQLPEPELPADAVPDQPAEPTFGVASARSGSVAPPADDPTFDLEQLLRGQPADTSQPVKPTSRDDSPPDSP